MALTVESTAIPEVKVITPVRHEDDRGYFSETYNRRALAEAGLNIEFVQDNHSLSRTSGTVRGLHYQLPPFAQTKLLRVIRGSVLNVALDVRPRSETFGEHVAVELSASNGRQVLVPQGFANGFCTLEPHTEVTYKVDNHYAPEFDRGILWSDPDLRIAWPVDPKTALLSERDRRHPRLCDTVDLPD